MKTRDRSPTSSLTPPPATSPSVQTINSSPTRSTFENPQSCYRKAKALPYELLEHCMIYFEEGLHCQALDLLKSLLTSGTTSSTKAPAVVPSPQIIALIATLTVHPTLTTRAKSLDRIQASVSALQYLYLLLRHVGPTQGRVKEAFTFTGNSALKRRAGGGRRREILKEGVSPSRNGTENIDGELANAGALWSRAENFWQILGWCFNCSVLHPRRWEVWRAWLEYMVEVLETDWQERSQEPGTDAMEKSLIVKYIIAGGVTAGRERIITRAIFADGGSKSIAEFGEIWPNETKELKKDADAKKANGKIDIEADNYGDYIEEENDSDLEDAASEPDSSPPDADFHSQDSVPDTSEHLGGTESINLRLRFLSLLSKVSAFVPESFTHLNTLYQIYFDHIRPLPIPVFFQIVSPPSLRHLEISASVTLIQYILRSLIAASAPLPPNDDINQDVLEASYLPYPANSNSIADNTRVSLCVETLLRLLNSYTEGLNWSPALQEAMEVGIRARSVKARQKQKKRGIAGDGVCDPMWLEASGERIRTVVEMAKPR